MRVAFLLILSLALATPGAAQVDLIGNQAAVQGNGQAEPPPQTIALESPDPEIAERLDGLFREMEGLDQVVAEVSRGVVTLTGTALTAEDRQRAESVASRLSGVVSVENDIAIEHRIDRRLEPMIAKTESLIRDTIAFLPLLVLSLLVFAAIWLLGRLLTHSQGIFRRIAPNPLVQTLVAQIIRMAFILVGLVVAMRILGATAMLGSVLGAAGIIGLAIGFAVRDTIENYIASILLSIRRPFAPNDLVIIEGLEGRVTRLNSRATFLTSLDGNELRIPNSIVYKAKITNFSQIPERRFEFTVGVDHANDLCRTLATALAAVKSVKRVLATPEPSVVIHGIDESSVAIRVFGWVDQRTSEFLKVRSEAIRAVKEAFERDSIAMPAPIQNIRMVEEARAEPEPARAPTRAEAEEVSDTSPDRTIEEKVEELRSRGLEEDLLTTDAPKE